MLTGGDPSTPQIIRLQAASGGFRGTILTVVFAEIFHRPTQAVRRIMGKRGFMNMIVYLDNFHVIGATRSAPIPMKSWLLQLLQDLGFTISQRKLMPPTCTLTFLGVDLDTVSCSTALPQEKFTNAKP